MYVGSPALYIPCHGFVWLQDMSFCATTGSTRCANSGGGGAGGGGLLAVTVCNNVKAVFVFMVRPYMCMSRDCRASRIQHVASIQLTDFTPIPTSPPHVDENCTRP